MSIPALGPAEPYPMDIEVSFPGVKRPEHEADLIPPLFDTS
jgi:hypothetical protein